MGFPAFVNSGAWLNTGLASAATPVLPGSRVNNNLLVAQIAVAATGRVFSVTAGWTIQAQENAGGESAALATRLVDGTETACGWTWTGGNATSGGQINQYSGNATVTPIGSTLTRSGTGTTITIGGVTTSADNSLIWCVSFCSNSQTIPNSGRFTNQTPIANANTSVLNCFGTVGASGTLSDTDFQTISSAGWASLTFEIHGTGSVVIPPQVRVSQVEAQILKTQDATNVLASQVVQQVLKAEAGVVGPTSVIVSQVVQQVLQMRGDTSDALTHTLVSQVVLQVLRRLDLAPTRVHASQVVLQVLRSNDRVPIIWQGSATLRGTGRLDADYLANWPVDLPDCPYEWDEQAQGNGVPFKPEVGPTKMRRNYSLQLWLSHVAFRFNNYETTVFEFFYSTTLRDGALPFYWPHPITKIMYMWKFMPKERPLITRTSPKTTRAEYRLVRIEQVPVQ
jgi:hypothetical protein